MAFLTFSAWKRVIYLYVPLCVIAFNLIALKFCVEFILGVSGWCVRYTASNGNRQIHNANEWISFQWIVHYHIINLCQKFCNTNNVHMMCNTQNWIGCQVYKKWKIASRILIHIQADENRQIRNPLTQFVRRPLGNLLQHIIRITIEYHTQVQSYTCTRTHTHTHSHTPTSLNIPATIFYHLFALNISIWPMLRLFESFLKQRQRQRDRNTHTHANNKYCFRIIIVIAII